MPALCSRGKIIPLKLLDKNCFQYDFIGTAENYQKEAELLVRTLNITVTFPEHEAKTTAESSLGKSFQVLNQLPSFIRSVREPFQGLSGEAVQYL